MSPEEVQTGRESHSEMTSEERPFSTAQSSVTTTSVPSPTKPLTDSSERLRFLTDTAFRFIGNASNETLGACAIGLCASTYLVLGRIGLVLIGAFGGVLLHATWEGAGSSAGQEIQAQIASRKKELGIEVVKRALNWRDTQYVKKDRIDIAPENKVEVSTTEKTLDFSTYPTATASALDAFTQAVIRDYVKWWYSPLLPAEESFPRNCRQILVAFIHSFTNHISRKRAADPFLTFFADSTSVLIVFLQELALALKASQRQDVEDALNTYLRFEPDSNLANVINEKQQKQKLHMVADDILQNFLDSKTYNCLPARSFLHEILAGLILDGTLIACSQPEWINGWIVYLLEDGEPELMNAIDVSVSEMQDKANESIQPLQNNAKRVQHQRRVSKAEQAMEEAMHEAQRINAMIAEEDAMKRQTLPATDSEDALSTATTTDMGIATPSSSNSGQILATERTDREAVVFDSEGNTVPSINASPAKPKVRQPASTFTSFDQLEPQQLATAVQTTYDPPTPSEPMVAIPLTLHNAGIEIMDLGESNDQVPLKQKPTSSMLVQIEPASTRFPGWMIERQYAAFEPLHETLRRIATVSGVPEFNLKYPELPTWKGRSRAAVIIDLTNYLGAALKAERLAESDSMKRFLDKETGLSKVSPADKNILIQGGAALENVGKNFINVLGQGGKGLQTGFQTGGKAFQTGGKAVLGGVSNVFGAVTSGVGGPKRPGLSNQSSFTSPSSPFRSTTQLSRESQDVPRSNHELDLQRRDSPQPLASSRSSNDYFSTSKESTTSSQHQLDSSERLNLPPPPDQITDEYEPIRAAQTQQRPPSISSRPMTPTLTQQSIHPFTPSPQKTQQEPKSETTPPSRRKQDVPINMEETKIAVELMFAVITELLSLSNAWTFRLSLLTAAKTYLLRQPAQLDSIRALLQESIVDANFSDEGIATHIRKLRENTIPTEEERAKWPKELTAEEKEKLRVKARRLLVERGMPQALTAVVGVAASGEALGKVFDCLQIQQVARGLMFALMLQAIRSVTQ